MKEIVKATRRRSIELTSGLSKVIMQKVVHRVIEDTWKGLERILWLEKKAQQDFDNTKMKLDLSNNGGQADELYECEGATREDLHNSLREDKKVLRSLMTSAMAVYRSWGEGE